MVVYTYHPLPNLPKGTDARTKKYATLIFIGGNFCFARAAKTSTGIVYRRNNLAYLLKVQYGNGISEQG